MAEIENQVFISILISNCFPLALAFVALFFQSFSIGIEKQFPRAETFRHRHRRRWYGTIQILSSIADQQFVSALELLASAVGNFQKMTIYHSTLAAFLAFLCHACFLTTLDFENLPLEEFDPKERVYPETCYKATDKKTIAVRRSLILYASLYEFFFRYFLQYVRPKW